MGVLDASDSRLAALTQWVVDDLGFAGSSIAPASADASFRRYFRVTRDADTYIVMDAPPAKEDVGPFVKVARLLAGIDVNVPLILAQDLERGFLLLSDLGSPISRRVGRRSGRAAVRRRARGLCAECKPPMRASPAICRDTTANLLREMELMPEWFLVRHLGLALERPERAMLDGLFESLLRVGRGAAGDLRASRLSLAQSSGHGGRQSRHSGFSGCRVGADHLRSGVAAQGLLHRVAAGRACAHGR